MPEHLRAFVVVAVLGYGVLRVLSRPLGLLVGSREVRRLTLAWLLVTAAAFLSGNFWLYAVMLLAVVTWLRPSPSEAAPLFLALVFAVPSSGALVPGFGVVNYVIELNHVRLLSIFLLVPACLAIRSDGYRGRSSAVYFPSDAWVFAYISITCLLQFRLSTLTESLRACFLICLDVFLPYYFFSRVIVGVEDIKRVMVAYVLAASVMGILGLFEMLRAWNLYAGLVRALDTSWGLGGYLLRDGMQRASVSTGQSIAFGYAMAVGIGFWLYLQSCIPPGTGRWRPTLLLCVGLISSLSRGPWLGAALLYGVVTVTQAAGLKRLITRTSVLLLLCSPLLMSPLGDRVLNLLPFFGKVDVENVEYRSKLLETSLVVIGKKPFFGSADYLQEPEMQVMVQGQGIIDVVNSYLGVALSYGLVGLFFFAMVFVVTTFQIFRVTMRQQKIWGGSDERVFLGRCLGGTLLSIAFMIVGVSSISIIGLVYWCVIGVAGAYLAKVSRDA